MAFLTAGGSQIGSANITDGSIVDADINNSAAISLSKLSGALAGNYNDTIINPSLLQWAVVSLSSADILALHTTPKILIPAPGAGKIIVLHDCITSLTAGTAYANGAATAPKYTGGATSLTNNIAATAFTSATNRIVRTTPLSDSATAGQVLSDGIDKPVQLLSATAFITGTGTMKIFVSYRILTL
jgi:hypothetical protein